MAWERTENTETYKEKYKDFKEMLSDSNISDEEKAELQESYNYECEQTHSKTQEMCRELKTELSVYNKMKEMSRSDIVSLQRIIGIPKRQRDGIKGPQTFSQYFSYTQKYPALANISLSETITQYDKYKDVFNSQTRSERKKLQASLGLKDDGIYGPQTFWAMYNNISSPKQSEQDTLAVQTQEKAGVAEKIIAAEPTPKAKDLDAAKNGRADALLAEANTSEETLKNTPERNKISPEELQAKLIDEAKTYSKQLIMQLQSKLWFTNPDGAFGPLSADKAIQKHPDIHSMQWLFEYFEVNTDIDGPLSQNNNLWVLQENFLSLYGEYIESITKNIGIPKDFVEAIIWKETTYGKNLNSGSGSKWLMQLTRSAFHDMRWDVARWKWKDHQKVRRYQEIFKSIDLDALLSVRIWNKWPVKARIPSHIIDAFTTIKESDTISEVQSSIDILKNHIKWKWKSKEYDHESNILIGTVYLEFIRKYRAKWDLWNVAFRYNGNAKKLANGKTERQDYKEKVMKKYKQISKT